MSNQGQHLAALTRNFHDLRGPFLKWAAKYRQPDEVALAHYRRALIGWYEARIEPEEPFTGEIQTYVQRVTKVYFDGNMNEAVLAAERRPIAELGMTTEQNPLNHLPRPIQLNTTQQLMLTQFKEQGKKCQDLLLMFDYHRLSPARIAEIIGLEGQVEETESRRDKCLLMVREAWQAGGITDPVHIPSPVDEELIDGPSAPQNKSVANFEPLPNFFNRMAPRDAYEEDLKRILYYYDRGDYNTAYDELLPVAQAYPAAPLYLGVCALALKQPTRALEWLEQIPRGSFYHPYAEWYEALAYLAEGNSIAAETVLEEIRETPGHPYRGKAGEVLGEI